MKKHFITGLVILLPLAVTIAIALFIIDFLTKPFVGMVSATLERMHVINKGFLFLSPEQLVTYGSKVIILILLFLFTIILGVLTEWFFINFLFRIGDKILHRIPLINTVYKTTQDIIKTVFSSDKNAFKQVVMVPYPNNETFVLGLVSSESPKVCSNAKNKDLISVFVPTTPNPTTGFLLMYPRETLIVIDMKPEDAFKYIVSCGVIVPPIQQKEVTSIENL